MVLNDEELNVAHYIFVCKDCKHYQGMQSDGTFKCAAFDKIPAVILEGKNKHKKPLENQRNGITFEAK